VHAHAIMGEERQARLTEREDIVLVEVRLHDAARRVPQSQRMPDFVCDGDTNDVTALERGDRRVRSADRSEPQASKPLVDGRDVNEHDWQLSVRVRDDTTTGLVSSRLRGGRQANVDRQGAVGRRLTSRTGATVVPLDRNRGRFEQRAGHLSCQLEICLWDRRMPNDIRAQDNGEKQGCHAGNRGLLAGFEPDLYRALRGLESDVDMRRRVHSCQLSRRTVASTTAQPF